MEKTDGTIHISEDVIIELARKTISGIPGIQTVNSGLASKLGIGKKMGDGIRIVVEDGKVPAILVDAYVSVKYGQRIPDVAWDVQEKIKNTLESFTGYTVKMVNINVQAIHFDDEVEKPEEEAEVE